MEDAKGSQSGAPRHPAPIGPIVLGGLNERLIRSGRYRVEEHIALDENGGATVTRRSDECLLKVDREFYDSQVNSAQGMMPQVRLTGPCFEMNHSFVASTLVGYRASAPDGKGLEVTRADLSGSSRLSVKLPMVCERLENEVLVRLPAYVLQVQISSLAQLLGDVWYCQWSHGPAGPGQYRLSITVPNLRRGFLKTAFQTQFFTSSPRFQKLQKRHRLPFRAVPRPAVPDGTSTAQPSEPQRSTAEVPSSFRSTLLPSMAGSRISPDREMFTYSWEQAVTGPGTISTHIAYGLTYRQWLFSPLGFLISNVAAIALTVLLTSSIERLLTWLLGSSPGTH